MSHHINILLRQASDAIKSRRFSFAYYLLGAAEGIAIRDLATPMAKLSAITRAKQAVSLNVF